MISGADFISDNDGGCACEPSEKCNAQPFYRSIHRHRGDGGRTLSSQYDVDEHRRDPYGHFIHEDREAFSEKFFYKSQVKMKNSPEFKEERHLSANSVDYNDDKIDCLCDHGAPGGTDDAHFRCAECAEDQDIVAHAVRADRRDSGVEREPHSVRGTEQCAHGDCQALENVGHAGHPEITDADFLNHFLVRVEGQDGSRCSGCQK